MSVIAISNVSVSRPILCRQLFACTFMLQGSTGLLSSADFMLVLKFKSLMKTTMNSSHGDLSICIRVFLQI